MINNIHDVLDRAQRYDVVSFDLFDTLLYRDKLSLEAVLHHSARNLLSYIDSVNTTAQEVLQRRGAITKLIKESLEYDTEEPVLRDVFQLILASYQSQGDIKAHARQAEEFELSLELRNLTLLDGVKETLQGLKDSGKTIIAVSDMYFDHEQICRILKQLGIYDYFDAVFVSATEKKTKYTSELFSHILNKLNLNSSQVIHVGDNLINDYKMAKKVGIDAVRFEHVQVSQYKSNQVDSLNVIDAVTEASIVFLLRTLLDCRQKKINTLFFLTRDAVVFNEIANQLRRKSEVFRQLAENIEFKELHISRTTTAFLSIHKTESVADVLSKMLWLSHGEMQLNTVCDLLGWSDIVETLQKSEDRHLIEQDWTEKNIHHLIAYLTQQAPQVGEHFVRAAQQHADTTMRYLQQQGAINSQAVAFVDLGYTSTATREIAHYLCKSSRYQGQAANTKIIDYLLIEGPQRNHNHHASFMVTDEIVPCLIRWQDIPDLLKGNFSWLECFFADKTRGALCRYEEKEGSLTGAFNPGQTNFQNVLLEHFTHHETRYIEKMDSLYYMTAHVESDTVKQLLSLFLKPSHQTLKMIAELTQGVSALETELRSIINDKIALSDFRPNTYRKNLLKDMWYVGSIHAAGKKHLVVLLYVLKKIQVVKRQLNKPLSLAKRVINKAKEYIK